MGDVSDISFLQHDPAVTHKLGLRQHHANAMETLDDLIKTVVSTYDSHPSVTTITVVTNVDMHDLFNQLDDLEDFDALF